ncbi:hypothetical protein ACTM8Z_07425 [Atopobiaceae bacterium HCP3S3_D6]
MASQRAMTSRRLGLGHPMARGSITTTVIITIITTDGERSSVLSSR